MGEQSLGEKVLIGIPSIKILSRMEKNKSVILHLYSKSSVCLNFTFIATRQDCAGVPNLFDYTA